MAGEDRSAEARSSVGIVLAPAGVFALDVRGCFSFARAAEVMQLTSSAFGEDPTLRVLVLDMLRLDGFEPGVPARLIHWMAAHTESLAAVYLVTMSPVLVATARAASVMVPGLVCTAVPTRHEAMRAGVSLANPRARTETGVRPSAPEVKTPPVRKVAG